MSLRSLAVVPRKRFGVRFGLIGWLALASASAALSCAGAPAAPQAPSSSSPVAVVPLPRPADLSPVLAPSGLVVRGVVTKLGASLATVHGWTQLPMPESDQVTEAIAGEALGGIVDLDQPIDFAAAVSGSGSRLTTSMAISAGVRDVEASKAALSARFKLVPGDNGALIIQRPAHPTRTPGAPDEDKASDEEDTGRACELAPSYGAPAMRLVCGWDAKSLAALAPWLTRGATRDRSSADAEIRFRMEPLKATIASERRILSLLLGTVLGGPVGASGGRDLAQALGGDIADFAADMDTAALDVTLSDPGATATLTLKLSGITSAAAKCLTSNADRNGPAPAAFWQMPADADFALFGRGIDPNLLARGRDLVLKFADDKLAGDGVKDADRHSLTDSLGKLVTPAPMVFASGVDAEAVRRALAAEKALPEGADLAKRRDARLAVTQAWLGWRILEVDEPAATRIDALKGLAAAWSRPSVSAAYKASMAGGFLGIRSAPVPKGVSLPKDTQHFAIDVSSGDPSGGSAAKGNAHTVAPPKRLSIEVFVVPDGTRTWIGIGADAAIVTSRLSTAIAGTGEGLRARAELAFLKEATIGTAGFLTARGLLETGQAIAALGGDFTTFGAGDDFFGSTAQLPHQGTTAVPFTLTPASGTSGTAVATLQVSRATVEDILVIALKHGI